MCLVSLLMLCVRVSNMSHVSCMNLHGDQMVSYLSVWTFTGLQSSQTPLLPILAEIQVCSREAIQQGLNRHLSLCTRPRQEDSEDKLGANERL